MGPVSQGWQTDRDGNMSLTLFSIPLSDFQRKIFLIRHLDRGRSLAYFSGDIGRKTIPRQHQIKVHCMSHPFQTDAGMMDFDEAAGTIVEEEKPEVGLELHVGSNIFRTT